jgi:hypothetical protein
VEIFLPGSPSTWFDVAVVAAIAKFACAIASARWPGGPIAILDTWRGRLVYAAGKITPLIAVAALFVYYKLSDPSIRTWWLVLAFAAIFLYDAFVVWLRLTNRWHAADHDLESRGSRNGG